MTSNSAQLEREAEDTRARMAETLTELRARITPGQIVDEVLEYGRHGAAAEFLGNLQRQVVQNPLSLALVGAGLGWLMLAGNRPAATNGDLSGRSGETASGISERATESAGWVRDKVGSTYDQASQRTEAAAAKLRDTSATVARRATGAFAFCREQPLVLAGLGLAIGAALGSALPRTEAEDQAVGKTSDRPKQDAQALAEGQLEKAKTAVEAADERGKETAAEAACSTASEGMDGRDRAVPG